MSFHYKFRYIGGASCELNTALRMGVTEFKSGVIYKTSHYQDVVRLKKSREFEIIEGPVDDETGQPMNLVMVDKLSNVARDDSLSVDEDSGMETPTTTDTVKAQKSKKLNNND